ncbi:ADP/ATP mitochondrial translocase, putative [Trypanosoma brucei gambiense DAL972]|uniref:ADP/ATP translocase n=1 Tax=Trypanosoma brucei gambiense (strain MHOM/CI/86/DAL972) TaxID=679716 RepID=C9ZSY0_TRYB9|nr:ADP/ATP mitochondrial translocase, putative [Trypanosoma brucei gambiense DAL972]CBH12515.1 ADP/ATP mitochondrial translocase, putative [Trypanosoma brucei gambiense DAL972]|eukprot:XP_011774795.1 ADP/ATP mitochondrial translocase, putative [Trypanosoma brucei gambiense DAL972]
MDHDQLYDSPQSAKDSLLDMTALLIVTFAQRAVMAPSYRVTLLATVEGELVREGRLPPKGFGGVFGCIKRLYVKEGVRSFFRGLLTDAVLSLPATVVENISSTLVSFALQVAIPVRLVESMNPWTYLTLSLSSTSAAVLLATPATGLHSTIVTNYVADIVAPVPSEKSKNPDKNDGENNKVIKEGEKGGEESYRYATATEAAASIFRRWGFSGFYRCIGADAIAVFLYRGTYYYGLQLLPSTLHNRFPYGISRCLAVVAGFLTQPFEVVSRRMQLTASSTTGRRYKGILHCARTIVAEEGYTALWAGMQARLLVTCVGVAVLELHRHFWAV